MNHLINYLGSVKRVRHQPGFFGLLLGLIVLVTCATSSETSTGPENITASTTAGVRNYVGHSPDECSRIRFRCKPEQEYFSDDKGCGCVDKSGAANSAGQSWDAGLPADKMEDKCANEERKAELCAQDYEPVCGLFDPAKVQCIKAPCGQTFANRCEACKNPQVQSITFGECSK